MQALISETLLQKLEARERSYDVRDTRLKGFMVRVQAHTGVKSYLVDYKRGRKYTLGQYPVLAPKEARLKARQILGEVFTGGDPQKALKKAKAYTLQGFILEEYLPWAESHLRSAQATVNRLLHDYADFAHVYLGAIDPWLIEKTRSHRLKKGLKAGTVNRSVGALKTVLNRAQEWGFLDVNPIQSLKPLKEDTNITPRYLTKDEYWRLLQALNERDRSIRASRQRGNAWRQERGYALKPSFGNKAYADHLKPMVVLALHTGARKGELYDLMWHAVDLERRVMTVVGYYAKNGKTRHIPLNREAHEVLSAWKAQSEDVSGRVFPSTEGRRMNHTRRSWKSVLEAAEISDFRWHDMRHTFASWLVMAGVELNTVRELLGHADYTMTLRYAHLAPELKAEAVAKLC